MPEPQAIRKVISTRTMRGACYVIGAFAIISIALLCFFGFRDISQLKALATQGTLTQGTITFKHDTFNKTHSYFLSYAYGSSFLGEQEVDLKTYVNSDVGDPIRITYLPTNPAVHREGIVNESRVTAETWKWGWAILAVLAFSVTYWVPIRIEFLLQKRILRDGMQTQGQIFEDIVPPKSSFHRVRYRFTDNHGVSHDRKTIITGSKDKDLKLTMITVYYLEGKENKSRILREFNLAKLA